MSSAVSSTKRTPMSPVLRAGLMQICLTVFTGLILDGGIVSRVFLQASLGFWCGVLLIAFRRWESPTKTDVVYLRHGLWGVLVISFPIAEQFTELSGGMPYLMQALRRR
ncbi:MAG: hypothetical protein IAG10_00390 [Planctomycetaceae bacterium]|nr:hypothetical protein [Planctomycetaceae bacterium]